MGMLTGLFLFLGLKYPTILTLWRLLEFYVVGITLQMWV